MADDKGVNWCELPKDILGSISQRLQYKDHIWLRMVCKSWRRLTHGTRPDDTFPWLFSLKDWCYGFFKPQKNLLYNPVRSHIDSAYYWVNNKAKHKCTSTSTLDLYSSRTTFRFALALRFGWLLVRETCPCELLFLYNPFSLEVIELPGFPFTILGEVLFFVFTFSYCPELRRFEVYGIMRKDRTEEDKSGFLVTTWLTGDKEWKVKNFSLAGFDGDVMGEIFKVECVKGTLNSVFTSGTVGAFDLFWRKALDRGWKLCKNLVV